MTATPNVRVGLAVTLAARDAVLAQLTRARELAATDARYGVTVASLQHTLSELGFAIVTTRTVYSYTQIEQMCEDHFASTDSAFISLRKSG